MNKGNTSNLIVWTKGILDFMFFIGIIVCIAVPLILKEIEKYYPIFEPYYLQLCISFMICGVLGLLILRELRKMFLTVIKGDPFVLVNVISLKKMGIYSFLIVVALSLQFLFFIKPTVIIMVVVFFVAGLFSLVLAQVFEQAIIYKHENDLTI